MKIRLNPFNRSELRKAFSFLLKNREISAALESAEWCYIKKADEDFLESKPPTIRSWEGRKGKTYSATSTWFIHNDQILSGAVEAPEEIWSTYLCFQSQKWGERYIDAVGRHGVPLYILTFHKHFFSWEGDQEKNEKWIEIRKLGESAKLVLKELQLNKDEAVRQVMVALSELD